MQTLYHNQIDKSQFRYVNIITLHISVWQLKINGGIFMNELTVKSVDVLGSAIIATKDKDGIIWAGVSYFCKALGMNKGQKDRQITNVQKDETLKKGCRKFAAGVFDQSNETVAIRLDFIPIWLAKITITDKMEHPELANKLLQYQLKAKDILADAFILKQDIPPLTLQQQIQTIAKGTDELYQRMDKVSDEVQTVKADMENIKQDLPLFPSEADEIRNAINKRVIMLLGGKEFNSYKDKSLRKKVFTDCYQNLKHNFGDVTTYKAIKRGQKVQALQIIAEYKPPLFLTKQIELVNAQQVLNI